MGNGVRVEKTYYDSGKLREEKFFRGETLVKTKNYQWAQFPTSLKSGAQMVWAPLGSQETTYKDNLKHGAEKIYDANGLIIAEKMYEMGSVKLVRAFNPNNRNMIISETPYENGKENGVSMTYHPDDGVLFMKQYYENGRIIKSEYCDKRGSVLRTHYSESSEK